MGGDRAGGRSDSGAEEIVEDDAGVISSVIVPTLTSVPEDAMESEEGGSQGSKSLADN